MKALMRHVVLALVTMLAVAGCDTETASERAYREGVAARNATIAAGAAQPQAVTPDEMTIGHKALTVYVGHPVDANDPRVARLDELIPAVAQRFGEPELRVGEMAVVAARRIEKEGYDELLTDVLDASLTATMGLDNPGDLPKVFALYAVSRTSGSEPDTAKRVTYAMLHLGE